MTEDKTVHDAREKLLAAGTELFAAKGFAGVSIRQLAETAGVNSALISYYYGGKEKLPFVPKTGRIKGAVNLPVGALYTPEGLYKLKDTLASMASKTVGMDLAREIILYCDTGKTCTSWAFVLSSWLGYKDVKIYDGSFMEWAKDPSAPME